VEGEKEETEGEGCTSIFLFMYENRITEPIKIVFKKGDRKE
jgi:hypothetical protein